MKTTSAACPCCRATDSDADLTVDIREGDGVIYFDQNGNINVRVNGWTGPTPTVSCQSCGWEGSLTKMVKCDKSKPYDPDKQWEG